MERTLSKKTKAEPLGTMPFGKIARDGALGWALIEKD
jgi:hypothetical protein